MPMQMCAHGPRKFAPRSEPRALRTLAAAALGVMLALPSQPASAQPAVAAAVERDPVDRSVLVGPSGQIYQPGAPGTWRRMALGGVAVDVVGAAMTPEGRIFVAGTRTPLYQFVDGVWHAHALPNRGRVILAPGSTPGLAVGPHIYLWSQGAWKRATSLQSPVTALWVAPDGRAHAATQRGEIARQQGARWAVLRPRLADGDVISLLVGGRRGSVHALSRYGAVFEVKRSRVTAVRISAELAGFVPHAATVASDGTLWVAGQLGDGAPAADEPQEPAGDAAQPAGPLPGLVLARVHKGALILAEPIEGALPDDRVTVLVSGQSNELLMATARGMLQYRLADGTWTAGTITGEVAPRPSASPGPGPAPSR